MSGTEQGADLPDLFVGRPENQGRWDEAIACYGQSLAIKREVGDRHGEGKTLNNLGNVYQSQARWEEAIDCYGQDLAICREVGDRHGEGQTLNNLGVVYQSQARSAEAIDCFEASLAIFQDVGDHAAEERARVALVEVKTARY